ncbi:hypothetical protein DH2020_046568 [Rehmannia glutinosa]|uniref:PGG domain-containing protein n=1 Tax=Rehmannia glutinosa TaxID=99300 RepID=A0ABR0UBW1_REHGL
MEISLETKLFEAAAKGNINSLQKLLNDDPLILDRVSLNNFSETPLHVAALLGHIDFVKEIISKKPELTSELNLHQSSPLHLASAKGHVDVVRALISVNPRTCMARDRNGLTPLHLAAIKGRLEVLKVLLQARRDAARVEVYGGENILHLCVKYYQLEALKLLVESICEPEFINARDSDGNTVLHLAVADKQVETINFLMNVAAIEVNALNLNGMTALDVLIKSRRDVRDSEIEESLKKAEIFRTSETNIPLNVNQKCVNGNPVLHPHVAGFSIMARNSPKGYPIFYIVNTTGFIASLSIILLLMSGLPLRRRTFMWILMVITWIAITAIALTYALSITMLTPPGEEASKGILNVVGYSVFVWVCLMALLLVGHTIRLMVKVIKKLRKTLCGRVVGSAVLVNNDQGV